MNQQVNCVKFLNFDRFCSQNLQEMSAECFGFLGTLSPDPLPGLLPLAPGAHWWTSVLKTPWAITPK